MKTKSKTNAPPPPPLPNSPGVVHTPKAQRISTVPSSPSDSTAHDELEVALNLLPSAPSTPKGTLADLYWEAQLINHPASRVISISPFSTPLASPTTEKAHIKANLMSRPLLNLDGPPESPSPSKKRRRRKRKKKNANPDAAQSPTKDNEEDQEDDA